MDYIEKINSKIFCLPDLLSKLKSWRDNSESIVFTNGCFDIIHYGHIYYMAKAKSLGDRLVLALNSDASVRRLKGESRPINNQNDRSFVLASLMLIDAIIIFDEDTPESLIKSLSPDVLAKGGDYTVNQIAGADYVLNNGGKVEIIDFVENYSSSKILSVISKER